MSLGYLDYGMNIDWWVPICVVCKLLLNCTRIVILPTTGVACKIISRLQAAISVCQQSVGVCRSVIQFVVVCFIGDTHSIQFLDQPWSYQTLLTAVLLRLEKSLDYPEIASS